MILVRKITDTAAKVSVFGNQADGEARDSQAVGNVDIRLLRIFLTVCECNGLSASEFELNIGRSTISKCISDLEASLALRLCDRGPSGFRLTERG